MGDRRLIDTRRIPRARTRRQHRRGGWDVSKGVGHALRVPYHTRRPVMMPPSVRYIRDGIRRARAKERELVGNARESLYRDGQLALGALLAVALVAGLVFVVLGIRAARRAEPSAKARRKWQRTLLQWHVIGNEDVRGWLSYPTFDRWDAPELAVPDDLVLNLERLTARGNIGGGLGLVGGCIATVMLSLATAGTPVLGLPLNPEAMLGVVLVGLGVGSALGSRAGMRDVIARAGDGLGELPAPTLPRYHRARLSLLPAVLLAAVVALTFALAPRILSSVPQTGQYPPGVRLPDGVVQGCVVLMALLFAGGEWLWRALARMPGLPLTADAALARRVDGVWRATMISSVSSTTCLAAGMVGIGIGLTFTVFVNHDLPSEADLIGFFALLALGIMSGYVLWGVAIAQGRVRFRPWKGQQGGMP